MKCKFCEAELPEDVTLCPSCGKDNAEAGEETQAVFAEEVPAAEEKPKGIYITPGKLAASIAFVVVVIGVLVALLLGSMEKKEDFDPTDAGNLTATNTAEVTEPPMTVPADGDPKNETCKGSYTASDAEVEAARDTVVATMGDAQLTNKLLNIYYWTQVNTLLEEYGIYVGMYGLDTTKPLDMQSCMLVEGYTWQQYFLYAGLSEWRLFQSLCLDADAAGYELSEGYQTFLEEFPQQMEAQAVAADYEDLDAMLKDQFGATATLEDLMEYTKIYYRGFQYYTDLASKIEMTEDDIRAYYEEHQQEFIASGIEESDKLADVRHILIQPENGTTDADNKPVFPEEDWQKAYAEVEALVQQWKDGGATEQLFGDLATEHTDDTASAMMGGKYTGISKDSNYVTEFKDWCMDAERKPGDVEIVKTYYGYHIMYYIGDAPAWKETAKTALRQQLESQILSDIMGKYEFIPNFPEMLLGLANYSTNQ